MFYSNARPEVYYFLIKRKGIPEKSELQYLQVLDFCTVFVAVVIDCVEGKV